MALNLMNRDALNLLLGNGDVKVVAAATTLSVDDQVVLVNGVGTYAITLPSCSEAKGKWYYFYCYADDSASVTVQDQDETYVPFTSDAMTAVGDYILLFCTGINWVYIKDLTT